MDDSARNYEPEGDEVFAPENGHGPQTATQTPKGFSRRDPVKPAQDQPLLPEEEELHRYEGEVERNYTQRKSELEAARTSREKQHQARLKRFDDELTPLKQQVANWAGKAEAAIAVARKECAEVGHVFQPGKTTAEDLLAGVRGISKEEAIRESGLPLGEGIDDRWLAHLKYVILALAFPTTAISIGLMTGLLDPEDLWAKPVMVALCFVMGGLMSSSMFAALSWLWNLTGVHLAVKRTWSGVFAPVVLTLCLLGGLASLEANALLRMSPEQSVARSSDESSDPQSREGTDGEQKSGDAELSGQIPLPAAWGIALLLGGGYVLASSLSAFCSGYRREARPMIVDRMERSLEAARSREIARVEQVTARAALGACDASLSELKRTQSEVESLERQRKAEEDRYHGEIPVAPLFETEEEKQRLHELRVRAQAARREFSARQSVEGRP